MSHSINSNYSTKYSESNLDQKQETSDKEPEISTLSARIVFNSLLKRGSGDKDFIDIVLMPQLKSFDTSEQVHAFAMRNADHMLLSFLENLENRQPSEQDTPYEKAFRGFFEAIASQEMTLLDAHFKAHVIATAIEASQSP